ncbi:hypothetical protein RFI_14124 [Reticulomyxa filosa]|uniref:Uncharacterized protein n=1 Tax=Reticulomyxa filosa TaxID=46433 RepID=X6N9T9_RETFI|nr:hypothetical protein RFI_14124 [Reticulomyxa filosa]|eukprot:ETO23060.1 hypothetical protein RFI_14124 [Reticulomyxa filosa]
MPITKINKINNGVIESLVGKINLWEWQKRDGNTKTETAANNESETKDESPYVPKLERKQKSDGIFIESPVCEEYISITSDAMGTTNPTDWRKVPLFSLYLTINRPRSVHFSKQFNLLFIGTEYGAILIYSYNPSKQVFNLYNFCVYKCTDSVSAK